MKCKKTKLIAVLSAVALVVAIITVSVMAYFSTLVYVYTNENGDKEIFHSGMNLSLLFGELNDSVNNTTINLPNYTYATGTNPYVIYNETVVIDTSAPLGSAKNPYVIETTKHLYNLSALQNAGYFDAMYLSKNFNADGTYKTGSVEIPYFLICTAQGTPVTVGGTDGKTIEIKPIGSLEHPFVGVIGGAFATGTTTVGTKTSSVSAIHNVKVQTTTNQTDVGLFGYIGFLGTEPTNDAIKNGTSLPQFAGAVSSIQDLLISDVQVVVKNPSLPEIVSELFGKLWANYFSKKDADGKIDGDPIYHRYTYTNTSDEVYPEETHHIGIFAGHASYANIDNISVYYSSESVKAIDLTAANTNNDNYYSVSGILGMFYNMNSKIDNSYTPDDDGNATTEINGHCLIKMGTGTTAEDLGNIVAGSGSGTGGGIYSGEGRGYVTASEIFSGFNNVDVMAEANNELLWRYKISDTAKDWVEGAILILEKKNADGTASYTLADGKTPVTISADKKTATASGGRQWQNFIVRQIVTNADQTEGFKYIIPSLDPTARIAYTPELMGNKYNGQLLWKYSAGGDGIWHYGVRVYKEGAKYYFDLQNKTDTEVTFNPSTCTITKTVNNKTVTWNLFFVSETIDGVTKHYMYDSATFDGNKYDSTLKDPISQNGVWSVSKFEEKPLTLIDAYGVNQFTNNEEKLCVQWMMDTAQGEVASGSYYFFDGVFTFGLSSQDDVVRDTWANEIVPTLYLGPQKPEDWVINANRGNRTLVSLLTEVKSNQQLDLAIQENKQFYISVQPQTNVTDAYFLKLKSEGLQEASTAIPVGNGFSKQDITIWKTKPLTNTKVSLENDLQDILWGYYNSGLYTGIPQAPVTGEEDTDMTWEFVNSAGELERKTVTLDDMKKKEFWSSFTVLNLGRTSDSLTLAELKTQYNIVPTNVTGTIRVNNQDEERTKYYYYYADTFAYAGTALEGMAIGQGTNNNTVAVPTYDTYPSYIYYTYSYVVPEGGYSYGTTSKTEYEKERLYTFEFFYQPAPVNGVIQTPISLGKTQVHVDGVDTTNGTYRMAPFNYGTVHYGQNKTEWQWDEVVPNSYGWGETTYTYDYRLVGTFVPSEGLSGVTITRQNNQTNGEDMFNLQYRLGDSNVSVNGIPMINLTGNRFHGEDDEKETEATLAILSEGRASKAIGTSDTYYYCDVATNQYYSVERSGNKIQQETLTAAQYNNAPANTIRLNRYPAYEFSDNASSDADKSFLQLLHQYAMTNFYYGKTGDDFSIWSGKDSEYKGTVSKNDVQNFDGIYLAKGFTKEGVLIFEEGEDYCYIQYTYDAETPDWEGGRGNTGTNGPTHHTVTKYLGYYWDEATQTWQYTLSDTKMPIYIYIIEGVIDTTAGVNTFVPSDIGKEGSTSQALPADQYVFWPQTTLKQDGVYMNNGLTKVPVADLNDDQLDDDASDSYTFDPIYKIVSLADLKWTGATGKPLGSEYGLDKKFQMSDKNRFGYVNIEGGYVDALDVQNANMLLAPVGSLGVESVIPKGCVAFSVNAKSTQTVRIIVAVPTTHLHLGEAGFQNVIDLAQDYYVGVWKMSDLSDNQKIDFNKSQAIEKFELPRSYSFGFEDDPVSIDKKGKHYVDVVYNNTSYRTYLNGDTFLVAYEFTIDGAESGGTYIIGTAHADSDTDVAMEIVHFSVSGTASAGRDGVQGNQLGAIDFVYDYTPNGTTNSTIVTLDRTGFTDGPANGNENYANHYASQSLLYTDFKQQTGDPPTYVKINQAVVTVRRYIKSTPTTDGTTYTTAIAYTVTSPVQSQADAILFKSYNVENGDTLEKQTVISSGTTQ